MNPTSGCIGTRTCGDVKKKKSENLMSISLVELPIMTIQESTNPFDWLNENTTEIWKQSTHGAC